MAEDGTPPAPSSFETLRDHIAARLMPVCEGWPRELFDEMVHGLTVITLKYDTTESALWQYDRRTTDRLIQEMRDAAERSQQLRTPKVGDAIDR
jgi:hypothetical protein